MSREKMCAHGNDADVCWTCELEHKGSFAAPSGSAVRKKYTIVARYGETERGCETDDIKGVWAATEYELCHGANDVTIIVNHDRPPNAEVRQGE